MICRFFYLFVACDDALWLNGTSWASAMVPLDSVMTNSYTLLIVTMSLSAAV